jgi:hypothetical protein
MRPWTTIRRRAIASMMAAALAVSMSPTTLAGGGGGGGTRNPFVGSWAGIPAQAGLDLFRYQFTFTKDFQFTLVEIERATGTITASFTGTYVLAGFGPNGFPVITMFSQGQILLQEEYSGAAEGIFLRGTIAINIGKV